jgi:SPP1 gp7 family putative phage head morphogenesis protein
MVYEQLLGPTQKELVTDEAEKALIEVWLSDPYDMTPVVEKKLKKNIDKFAWSIDMETNTKLVDNFKTILSEWLSIDEWTSLLQSTFTELTESRAEKIVRTETIRASNFGTEEWRKQSGVVVKKEWYTAVDERVCPYCNSMNGTIVWLDTSYIDNGETMDGGDEWSMKIDYGNVDYPPLHCNCRCTILPVIWE